MIEVVCPRCARKHQAGEEHAGRMLRCAGCGDAVVIGTSRSNAAPVLWTEEDGAVPLRPRAKTKFWRRKSKLVWGGALFSLLLASGLTAYLKQGSHDNSPSRDLPSGADSSSPTAPAIPLSKGEFETAPSSSGPFLATPKQAKSECAGDIFDDVSRPANGQNIGAERDDEGLGQLRLINGTQSDAVVRVYRAASGVLSRAIYVRQGETAFVGRVSRGKYVVKVATGGKWSSQADDFEACVSYFKFAETYEFKEIPKDGSTEYDQLTLTLHTVPNGNVEKTPITREEFFSGEPET